MSALWGNEAQAMCVLGDEPGAPDFGSKSIYNRPYGADAGRPAHKVEMPSDAPVILFESDLNAEIEAVFDQIDKEV